MLVDKQAIFDVRGGERDKGLGVELTRGHFRGGVEQAHDLPLAVEDRGGDAGDISVFGKEMLPARDHAGGACMKREAERVGAAHVLAPDRARTDGPRAVRGAKFAVHNRVEHHAGIIGKSRHIVGARNLVREQFQLRPHDGDQAFVLLFALAQLLKRQHGVNRLAHRVEAVLKAAMPTVGDGFGHGTRGEASLGLKRTARFHENGLHNVLPALIAAL
mmetsp:Transcript_13515/g.21571  ORF Transcript_13515/g.21571 Transcript_13515/m.21571 type:complete len:217 (+) Transcript_13515:1717-2367(+)